jgi:hypothetical protein
MGVDEHLRKRSEDDMMAMADAAESDRLAGRPTDDLVFHGRCLLYELDYVDKRHLFLVPSYHGLLFNTLKPFMKRLKDGPPKRVARRGQQQQEQQQPDPGQVISPSMQAVLQARAQGIHLHPQFNRRYTCVIRQPGLYTMEDWKRFALTFSPFILGPVRQGARYEDVFPTPELKAGYGHLRENIAFHLTCPEPYDPTIPPDQQRGFATWEELGLAADAAAERLLEFFKLAEQVRRKHRVHGANS